MTAALTLLVDAVATFRLTRLVLEDSITDPIRDRLIEAAYIEAGDAETHRAKAEETSWTEAAIDCDNPPKLAVLLTCWWCASVWIAAGVVLARRLFPRAWSPAAELLALSAAAVAAGRAVGD